MPCALIFDVKGSRQLDNWREVFKSIKSTLTAANRHFADNLLVKFQPTVGDEFQGALKSPAKAYDLYTFIKASLPVQIYCGMGIGEVEITGKDATGLRGTAFYRAREALEMSKNAQGLLRISTSDTVDKFSEYWNILLRLMETMELDWTPRQRQIVNYQRLNPELRQNVIARHFKITEPTLSKIFKNAHWEVISITEKYISENLP
jgi:hypothetical protein